MDLAHLVRVRGLVPSNQHRWSVTLARLSTRVQVVRASAMVILIGKHRASCASALSFRFLASSRTKPRSLAEGARLMRDTVPADR
jgi:hypothetical protein